MHENRSSLVKGALLLTLAGLISKVLSASYRVPLQNLTGDHGFYIYQQVYPILGMIIVISLYGFPSAIAKLTVEQKMRGKNKSLMNFYLPILFIMFVINGFFSLFLFVNATSIAALVGDSQLKLAYQYTAIVFLLVPFTTILRGVFQGHEQMNPVAYSQIGEQIVRVSIIVLFAYLFALGKINIYAIGKAAPLASIMGAIVAICILLKYFIQEKLVTFETFKIPWGHYIRTIVIFGIVASLNHMVLLIIQFADVFTLVPSLRENGLTNMEAMTEKGVFDRGQPLIQLGTVLGSSFALALIPAASKQMLRRSPEQFYHFIQGGLLFSFYLAVGATVGLIIIFPETNTLLFQNTDGTTALRVLSGAIVLSSLSITIASILQGLGYFKRTALFICITFIIKWLANEIFVPKWGIIGSAFATVLSLLLLCVMLMMELRKNVSKIKLFHHINWQALTIASFGMICFLLFVGYIFPYESITTRLGLSFYVAFISIVGALIYIVLLLRLRAFTREELLMLPFASIFISIHRGRESS